MDIITTEFAIPTNPIVQKYLLARQFATKDPNMKVLRHSANASAGSRVKPGMQAKTAGNPTG